MSTREVVTCDGCGAVNDEDGMPDGWLRTWGTPNGRRMSISEQYHACCGACLAEIGMRIASEPGAYTPENVPEERDEIESLNRMLALPSAVVEVAPVRPPVKKKAPRKKPE